MMRRTITPTRALYLALLLCAFALRLYRLDRQEIWGDEAAKLEVVMSGVGWLYNLAAEVHPRFYHTWLYVWHQVFDFSAFGLRTLPVFFSLLNVALIGRLTRRIVGSSRAAILATAAMAFAPFHIYYAQDLTQYALLMLLATLSLLLLLRALRRPHHWARWALLGITYAALIHTHYYGAFVVVAHMLFLLWRLRTSMMLLARVVFVVGAIVSTLVLPWAIPHIAMHANQLNSSPAPFSIMTWLRTAYDMLSAYFIGNNCVVACALFALIHVFIALVGVLAVWRSGSWRGILLACSILVPLLGVAFLSFRMTWFNPRFGSAALPLLMALLGIGLDQLLRWRKPIFILAGAGVLASSVLSLNSYFTDPNFVKSEYGAMLKTVAAKSHAGDVIWLNGPTQRTLYQIYQQPSAVAKFIEPGALLADAQADAALTQLSADAKRVWLINTGPLESYDPQNRAQTWLNQHAFQSYYNSFPNAGASVYLFSFRGAAQPISQTLNVAFDGGITLLDATLAPRELTSNGTVFVTLRWRAASAIPQDYNVFVHVLSPDGKVVAQADGTPVGGARSTTTWRVNEIITDQYALALPDLINGTYVLQTGLYDWRSGNRLSSTFGDAVRFASSRANETWTFVR
jgi:4-amino-4-deoxy-L-arabinose transferase-like glycosyltransferase